jgi:hypothetical protein
MADVLRSARRIRPNLLLHGTSFFPLAFLPSLLALTGSARVLRCFCRRAGDGPSRSYPLHFVVPCCCLAPRGGVQQVAGRSTSCETSSTAPLSIVCRHCPFVILIVISPCPSLSFLSCFLSSVTFFFPPALGPFAVEFWLRVQHSHHRCSRLAYTVSFFSA